MVLRRLSVLLALTLGCSASSSGGDSTPGEPSGVDPAVADGGMPEAPIEWSPCTVPSYDGPDRPAECAVVPMPASRGGADTAAAGFPVRVARIRSTRKATHQLWLLNGGPGADGAALGPHADAMVTAAWEYDVYMPDHRGTGGSNPLSCADVDLTACGRTLRTQWGDRLAEFSTTESAWDVADLIRRTRVEGQRAFVLGLSYGTYWAHRLLQVAPEAADAVVLDGICLGERCTVDRVGANLNEGIRLVLEACKSDAFCAGKLSADPMGKAQQVATRSGTACGSAEARRDLLFALASAEPALLPALVARLDRCSASDQIVVKHLAATLTANDPGNALVAGPFGGVPLEHVADWDTGDAHYSRALGAHIRASEMVSTPRPSDAEFFAKNSALPIPFAGSGAYDRNGLAWIDSWPRYVEPRAREWATLRRPVLFVNGRFDVKSPLANLEEALPHFDPAFAKSVVHPTAGHGVLFASDCGWSMLHAFLQNPEAAPDSSCLSDDAVDFSRNEHSQYWFGTASPWD